MNLLQYGISPKECCLEVLFVYILSSSLKMYLDTRFIKSKMLELDYVLVKISVEAAKSIHLLISNFLKKICLCFK